MLRAPVVEVDVIARGGLLVEQVPPELVHDQHAVGSKQLTQLVEDGVEIVEVMEREARQDRVEGAWLVELLDRRLPEDRSLRSLGIHCNDVIAGPGQSKSRLSAATPDFEDPSGRRRQM